MSANITSTMALYPNQITSCLAGRKLAGGAGNLSLGMLFWLSLAGGVCGALLLLNTPVAIFAGLAPWLVLTATLVFTWGSFRKAAPRADHRISSGYLGVIQFLIGVYGGYFGGGIGILMLAALTIAGQQVRTATATKNVLAMAMNTSAVALFSFSGNIDWAAALALSLGGVGGALLGSWLVHRLPEKVMRGFVVLVGYSLTLWLFLR